MVSGTWLPASPSTKESLVVRNLRLPWEYPQSTWKWWADQSWNQELKRRETGVNLTYSMKSLWSLPSFQQLLDALDDSNIFQYIQYITRSFKFSYQKGFCIICQYPKARSPPQALQILNKNNNHNCHHNNHCVRTAILQTQKRVTHSRCLRHRCLWSLKPNWTSNLWSLKPGTPNGDWLFWILDKMKATYLWHHWSCWSINIAPKVPAGRTPTVF